KRLLGMREREVCGSRQLVDGRLAAQFRVERVLRPRETAAPLVDVDRHPYRFLLVTDGAVDCLTNPPHRVCRELGSSSRVESLDGSYQAERALLDQVEEWYAAVRLGTRRGDDEPEVRLDHPMFRRFVTCLDPLRQSNFLGGRKEAMPADLAQVLRERVRD